MLKAKAQLRAVHVPYKGLTPALNDVAAGHVDAMFHDLASVQAPLLAGRVKLIAVGSESRISEMPDVSAVAELVPGFMSEFWYAMVAPPRTSPGHCGEGLAGSGRDPAYARDRQVAARLFHRARRHDAGTDCFVPRAGKGALAGDHSNGRDQRRVNR